MQVLWKLFLLKDSTKTTKWIKWQAREIHIHTVFRLYKPAYVLHKKCHQCERDGIDICFSFITKSKTTQILDRCSKYIWRCSSCLNMFFPEQNCLNRNHMDGCEVLQMNNSSRVCYETPIRSSIAFIMSCGEINTWAALELLYWKPSFPSQEQ